MEKVSRNQDLYEYHDDAGNPLVRVEKGPARKSAIATQELLDNMVTHPAYQVGQLDSSGVVIELGKEFEYITWPIYDADGNMAGESLLGWYVFSPFDSPPVVVSRLDPKTGKSVNVEVETAENDIGWKFEAFLDSAEEADALARQFAGEE